MTKKKARTWNLHSRITTELRRLWLYSPERRKAILAARLPGKQPFYHSCSNCWEKLRLRDCKVDHIEPIVPLSGWVSWDSFIERMFCDHTKMQVLCIDCHKDKTKSERAKRQGKRMAVDK